MSEPTVPAGALTDEERRQLHDGVCPRHRDYVPGVYVCKPCERAGDVAVEAIVGMLRHTEALTRELRRAERRSTRMSRRLTVRTRRRLGRAADRLRRVARLPA